MAPTAARALARKAQPAPGEVVDDLVQLAFAVTGALTRVGAAHDLSLTQVRLLGILRGRRPRMAELADHLGLEKSTVSGLVDRAEARGLVERGTAPEDGRAVRVGLSPAGRRLARVVEAQVATALRPLTRPLGGQDRRQLHVLVERMLAGTPQPRV